MSKPVTHYLQDYQPPHFWIDSIDLIFDLQEKQTIVHSTLHCRRNFSISKSENQALTLHGEKLILKSIHLNQHALPSEQYSLESDSLTIFNVPDVFTLEIKTKIYPAKNTELSGLYHSKKMYCTQCEAEGFRRITYYLDRPDVMAKFTTTIYADKKQYPVLISNGNCTGKGDLDLERHWAKWEDPFVKPSYLFALVAGNLVALEDHFITRSQRLVTLKIYVEPENQDKCQHALEALKKSMLWDEVTYGREYDLDIYMIVAVNDFNMGAMENKGLNIFNSKYVLARPETATDTDYYLIDAVVGHEYFHNWSGNRVTCRDWFQLSLKEGLTVFREHQFSRDISKSSVSLIENVRSLRASQFAEDNGPMAHPVRPESYIEINNFYTATVYEKGAELIGMIKTLIGAEDFRKGMDLYFERHDGQAVTTEDFMHAMETAANRDLSQFCLWYSQAGTPVITLTEAFDPLTNTYCVTLQQLCPPTPDQRIKLPMVIPVAIGLLDNTGKDILPENKILVLSAETETFTFPNLAVKPVLSLLRGFSAPVKIEWERNAEEWAFLLAHDSDSFNRWEAGQKLASQVIWQLVEDYNAKRPLMVSALMLRAFEAIIADNTLDAALKAEILTLPALNDLLQQKPQADIDAIYAVRTFLRKSLAEYLKGSFYALYEAHLAFGRYQYSPLSVASRRLKALCLSYLMLTNEPQALALCLQQWKSVNNMTDALTVLNVLSNWEGPERQQVLSEFYEKWQYDLLVLDKWFRVQALSELPNTLEVVKALMQHPAFEITNPNKVYSLIGAFTSGNLVHFHHQNGAAYTFLADVVIQLDTLNPQVASRMVRAFANWKQTSRDRQDKIRIELKRLLSQDNLSTDVFEIVSKCLAADIG